MACMEGEVRRGAGSEKTAMTDDRMPLAGRGL
jgi:hypothetical protein